MSGFTGATRQEKDSLGFVEVPAEALYGAQTARAIVNFPISGLRASPFLIRAIVMVKYAAAKANGDLGLITRPQADAIMKAAQEILDGQHLDQFVVDVFQAGAGVSFHMNTNEVLANRASQILGGTLGEYQHVHPNDHVNYGQSTNDVFPTAMRLSASLALQQLDPVLHSLAKGLEGKAKEFDGILKSGRTHMQDAVPIRLGQEFAAYTVTICRAKDNLQYADSTLWEVGLGGSAVGTGINTHPEYRELAIHYLKQISHVPVWPADDMRYAMQSCAPMATVSSALRTLALEVIRISNDLRLLSSGPNTGFREIDLPGLQPGSSIMPGKVNPVLPELAAMVGFQVIGNDAAVAMAVQGGQLELNVMMPTMAHNVLQSITILTNSLRELDHRCIRGITANADRCAFYAQSTVSLATALNPYIGYARAAQVVKESIATGRSIIDIVREEKLLTEDQIATILDARAMTEPRPKEA
ncbi:aspartate ammonia-lyase [Terriglobus roseus DSM 18391]|uniref:Aspartate ammonia-lyase n=1 Tax=Terriglobus roseus (strain DSM 18391 / NRRL B-41598 / KBS 63) TaxID=926566 RepID=I3ZIA0_TERRK|nr:aspartate ammonia-lyase [Terriglobus roseus]AFL88968.1 aspartate ammonia-lyase [Terriglobus roseus DSM 18391]